ncbi:MAG: hypothetical protein GC196_15410 [Hyphomonas sp.]|nr:hypothetical protein [Hyphomonas sp.]
MAARLMPPFCFASLLAAALIAEGAVVAYIPAEAGRAQPADNDAATYADICRLELLRDED